MSMLSYFGVVGWLCWGVGEMDTPLLAFLPHNKIHWGEMDTPLLTFPTLATILLYNDFMFTQSPVQEIPLVEDESGVIKIAGTRLGIEIILEEFNSGATPEEIAYNYDALTLDQVYAIIAYYLFNKSDLDEYVTQLNEKAEQKRVAVEKSYGLGDFRQQLMLRRNSNGI